MTSRKPILIATGVILLNLLLGHFFAPTGMMLTPIALTIATALVVFNTKTKPIFLTLIILGLIILHDIGLKLYSGGTHDRVGLGWLHLMMFIGLVPSYLMTIVGIIRNKQANWTEKIVSIIIFPLIIAGHLYISNDLGLGRHYWYEWN